MNKYNKDRFTNSFFIVIFILFVGTLNLQGIEFTDTGKWLSGFSIFFTYPEKIGWYFVNWLVWLNGAILYEIFSNWMLFALRIQCTLSFFLSYLSIIYLKKSNINLSNKKILYTI